MASIQERLEAMRQGRPPQNSGTGSNGNTGGSNGSSGGSIAQRLERMRQDGADSYGGSAYTPGPSTPTYSSVLDAMNSPVMQGLSVPRSGSEMLTYQAAAEQSKRAAEMESAIAPLTKLRSGSDMVALARQRDNDNLESLRQRAEELEARYRQISQEASRSRYRKYASERAEAGEQWRAARDEYEQALAEMGLEKPTFGERILKTLSGAAKQYLGSSWDTAGVMVSGGTAEAEIYQEQLESLYGEKQRTEEWLKQPEDEQERRQLENRLASLNEQILVYEALARESAGLSEGVRDAAAGITQSGAADLERAKYGAGKAGQLLVDAGAAGAQMAADAALGYLTGFGSMAPMMVRSFGGGAQQAREKGYSQKQQIALGLSSAATEYFSEKLFGGNPVYDSDAGLVSKLVGKITSNETVLEYLASKPAEMLYEGLEEVTADLLEPLAEQIIAGQHDEITLEQVIEDGLVGIILAGVGQGGQKIVNTATQGISTRQTGNLFSDMTDVPAFEVSEEDYQRAMQVTNLSLWSKGLKEIAQVMGKTPAQTMKYFEEIVRNYNLARYSSNAQAGQIYQENVREIEREQGAGDATGKTENAASGEAVESTAAEAVQAGRATTIYNPYNGEKPQYTVPQNRITPSIEEKSVADAAARIAEARAVEQESGRNFRKSLTQLYEQVFKSQGGSRGIAVNGASMDGRAYVVTINNSAIGKIISDKNISPQKLAVLDIIDEVIENGEYVESGRYVQKGNKQKHTIRFDYFETPVVIDGQNYIVTFDVEVFPSSNNYRTHKVINEMDIVSDSRTDAGTHPPQGLPEQRPFTGDIIAQGEGNVNKKTEATDRSSTSHVLDGTQVDISRQAVAPADASISQSTTDVNSPASIRQRYPNTAARAESANKQQLRSAITRAWWTIDDLQGKGGLTEREAKSLEAARAVLEINQREYAGRYGEEYVPLSDGPTFPMAGEDGMMPEAELRTLTDEELAEVENEGKQSEESRHEKAVQSQSELKKELQKLFSVPVGERSGANAVIDSAVEDIMRDGKLSSKRAEQLFDELYSRGEVFQEADDYYRHVREALKGQRIYVNDSVKADFGDDWNSFRQRALGNSIYLTNNAGDMGIDSVTEEMSSMFSTFDGEADLKEQLENIVDSAELGKGERLTHDEINDIIRQQYGDEAVEERMDKLRQDMNFALEKFAEKAGVETAVRRSAQEKIERTEKHLKQQQAEKEQRARERRKLREEQDKTLKQLQWLRKNQRKMQGTEYQQQADEILNRFNTWAKHMSNEMNVGEFKIAGAKFTGTWRDAVTLYRNAQKFDPNWLPSSSLEKLAQRIDPTLEQVGEMEPEALQDVYNFLTSLRHQWENRNRIIGEAEDTAISDVYHASVGEIKQASGGKATKGRNGFEKYLDSQLTPKNRIRKFVGWNPDSQFYKHTAQLLENAERRWKDYHVQAEARLNAFKKEYGKWVKTSDGQGKNATWYEYEIPELLEWGKGDRPIFGDTVKVYMTPAQKVGLYLSSKGYDNLRHIAEGGISLLGEDGKKLYAKGNRQDAYAASSTFRLAPETVKELVKDLTPEEQALAKVMEEYFNDFSKTRINETSNIVDGFDRAMAAFYYPIVTDSDYNKQESGKFDATAKGVGHLKERLDYGANPIVGLSVFDVFNRHVDQTAKYYGFTIAEHNINRLMNWREGRTSMRDAMSHAWGADAAKYVTDTLTELTSGRAAEKGVGGKLLSNYVSSVFGANPGIVLKQFASFPTVAAVLGFDTIPNILKKIDTSLIDIYTPELAYRSAGYGTPELAQLKNNPNWSQSNKAFKLIFGGGLIQAMDTATVKTIWSWSENYVKKYHAELEVGTEAQIRAGESAYYKKVAEMFNKAVGETQPMYDTMNRADIMRNSNPAVRAFTMFKTVPVQQGNLIQKAIGEARWASKHGTEAQKKAAAKQLANTTVSILGATIMLELIEFGNQFIKNAAKNYRDDDDDELTLKSTAEQFSLNVLKDLVGNFIGGSELCESMEKAWKGSNYSVLSMPGIEQLESAISMFTSAFGRGRELWVPLGSMTGKDADEYLKRYGGDMLGDVNDLAVNIGSLMGLPVANVQKYVTGILDLVSPKLGETYDAFFDTTTRADVKGKTGERLNVRVGALLDSRSIEASDDTVDELRRLYEATGNSSVLPHDTPSELGDTELTAAQQQEYDRAYRDALGNMLDTLTGSEDYAGFDDESKARALKYLYDYAAAEAKTVLDDKYELAGWMEPVSEGEIELNTAAQYYGAIKDLTKKSEKVDALRDMEISDTEKASVYYVYLATDKEAGLMDELYDKGRGAGDVFGLIVSLRDSKVSVDEYKKLVATGLDDDEYIISVAAAAAEKKVWDWRKIVNQGEDSDSTLKALSAYMSESQYEKAELAIGQYGINPSMYVTVQEELAFVGGKKQDDVTAAIDRVAGLNNGERAVLWQLCVSSKSSKNNPYDVKIGEQVLRELEG